MGETPEMLPCPFCGEDPWYGERMDEDLATHNQVMWKSVACPNGCAQIEIPDDYEGGTAVERWNRREATDALIEAERRGAERMQTRSIKLLEKLAETIRILSDRPDVDAVRAEHLALSLLDAAETIRALPLTEETPDA